MAIAQEQVLEVLDQTLSAAVAAAAPSVLHLARGHSGGSALAWTDELALTSSFHCPDQPALLVPDRGGELTERVAEVVGRDPGLDLALLRVSGGGLSAPARRSAADLAVGNLAIALGRPGRSVRASLRMVGVLGHDVRTPAGGLLDPYIETDRAVPRGFAGGPLIDAAGRVIGMNTRTLLRGHDLAVAADALERSAAELLRHGRIPRGYLGVGVTPVVLARQVAVALGKERGAMVSSVEDDGPAERGGVRQGDILIAVNGAAVTGPNELRQLVADRPGASLTVEVVRGGAPLALVVTLGTRP
jgi:S1-C subfamily serine protease